MKRVLTCKTLPGFTLAELLIALLILGVIATFTIPKVLVAQSSSRDKAIAKEAAAMVAGAFAMYKLDNTITNQWMYDFTPYMNYVSRDSVSYIDDSPGYPIVQCRTWRPCLRLHSGAIMLFDEDRIGGAGTNNGLWFTIDPDGKSGSANLSVTFVIYANGKLRTWGTMESPTLTNSNTYHPNPSVDPAWFSW
ncbi:MAG: prepilin-type N-terminal cleavage/methylation domain-containing protein [Vampirovibrionales bacterium]|nr:prepilin-type N-terminal cleavage/methylation domain-containing protein [Vampirovibrionales bacterium]